MPTQRRESTNPFGLHSQDPTLSTIGHPCALPPSGRLRAFPQPSGTAVRYTNNRAAVGLLLHGPIAAVIRKRLPGPDIPTLERRDGRPSAAAQP
jgi:hypothetical protein